MGDVLLYRHAQPAPVAYSDFEEFWSACIHPLAQDDELKDFAWDIWNACRAAMLAAAQQSPGSEPATVPGKWIPVSERIPIPGVDVLVAKEFFGPGDWRRKVGHVRHEESGWNIYGASWEPTHWMPLPAAPQEVKGD